METGEVFNSNFIPFYHKFPIFHFPKPIFPPFFLSLFLIFSISTALDKIPRINKSLLKEQCMGNSNEGTTQGLRSP